MQISKSWFQKNKRLVEFALLFFYFSINALINATTVLMHAARNQQQTFQTWEPFVWESSSALATLLLIPAIAWFTRQYSWQWQNMLRSTLFYWVAAFVFALLHIAAMVAMREFAYFFTPSGYDFATDLSSLLFELGYELRKDVWSFFFFIVAIEVYRYAVKQWLGDTLPITEQSEETVKDTSNKLPPKLLVRKMGKEFLIHTQQIEWLEASGNYLNLHVQNSVYPMRITMNDFAQQSGDIGFVRIHRSFIINPTFIKHIESLPSGDATITMQCNKQMKMSRRFKKHFEEMLASS